MGKISTFQSALGTVESKQDVYGSLFNADSQRHHEFETVMGGIFELFGSSFLDYRFGSLFVSI